jgi:hypothetical protein
MPNSSFTKSPFSFFLPATGMFYPLVVASLLALPIVAALSEEQKCERKEMTVELQIPGSTHFGSPHCVQERVAQREFCAPTAYEIKSFSWTNVTRQNVMGREDLRRLNDSCIEAALRGYSSDHTGQFPLYTCSAVTWVKLLMVQYCARDSKG